MRRPAMLVIGIAALIGAAGAGLVLASLASQRGGGGGPTPTPSPVTVKPFAIASLETQLLSGRSGDIADDSAIWRNAAHPERSFVVGDDKSDDGGVVVYDLAGRIVHHEQAGKIGNIDLRDGVRLGDRDVVLVGANDRSRNTMHFWTLDRDTGALSSVVAGPLPTLAPNYGFCLGRSANGAHTYAFVTAEGAGRVEQYELQLGSGQVQVRQVRAFDVGSQSEGCVVDDATGSLYLAEEDVAIWRFDLDPATGARRTAIDRAGAGHLVADIEGLAAARWPDGNGVLVASSQGDSTFAVYDLDGDHAFRGTFRVAGNGSDTDGASHTDGIALATGDFGPAFPDGLLVVHDGENHRGGDAAGAEQAPSSNLKFAKLAPTIGG